MLVVDSVEGATDQDATIAGEADKAGCGVIIVANKWDLMKGRGHDFSKEFDDKLRQQVKFLDYAPILHISALTGERTPKLLEAIDKVADARNRRDPDRRVEPVRPGGDRRASAGEPRHAAKCASCTPRRPASRRRRSCSSRTSRRRSTSPTSGS